MGIFEQAEMTETRKQWIVNIAGQRIPVEAINAFFKPIFSCICLALVFWIGGMVNQQTLKMAQECHTTCNMETCTSCEPQITNGGLVIAFNQTIYRNNHTTGNSSLNLSIR